MSFGLIANRLGAAALALFILAAGCAGPAAERREAGAGSKLLDLQTLTSGKKVIPLRYDMGQLRLTNVKLPDLVATNKGEKPVTITQVLVLGYAGADEVVRYSFGADVLGPVIAEAGQKLNKAFADPANDEAIRIGLGLVSTKGPFAESSTLKPSERAALRLARLSYLEHSGPTPLSSLTIRVIGSGDYGEISFPLDGHTSKGEYVFPLAKTNLMLANLPLNLTQHREMLSQEFAFDIVALGVDKAGVLNTSKGTPTKLDDFFVYRREVSAIGDGQIVEVADGFPEARMSNPKEYSEEFFVKLMKELVPSIGFKNAVCGNYVVIDHGNGEFSAYMHLSQGTIRKKVGDRVKRGEVIAQVGNTGHSTEPHLHFQVMDAADFLVANGLPVMFTNVKAQEMNQNISSSNSLLDSDYLLFNELSGQ
jgi:hypothetical protein